MKATILYLILIVAINPEVWIRSPKLRGMATLALALLVIASLVREALNT